jgi:hypothetical protein
VPILVRPRTYALTTSDQAEANAYDEVNIGRSERGFTLLPRHAVDVGQNEIARGFKLTTSTVEPIGFVVPRKVSGTDLLFPTMRDRLTRKLRHFAG